MCVCVCVCVCARVCVYLCAREHVFGAHHEVRKGMVLAATSKRREVRMSLCSVDNLKTHTSQQSVYAKVFYSPYKVQHTVVRLLCYKINFVV